MPRRRGQPKTRQTTPSLTPRRGYAARTGRRTAARPWKPLDLVAPDPAHGGLWIRQELLQVFRRVERVQRGQGFALRDDRPRQPQLGLAAVRAACGFAARASDLDPGAPRLQARATASASSARTGARAPRSTPRTTDRVPRSRDRC